MTQDLHVQFSPPAGADAAAAGEIIRAAGQPVFVHDLDGRILLWNRGAELLYGWSEAEACGQVCHELLGTRFSPPLKEILAALARQGCWEGHLERRTRQGRQVTVASRWSSVAAASGSRGVVLVTETEATEQVRALQALRENEQKYRTLAENSSDILYSLDAQGRITFIGPQVSQYGYRPEELIGQGCIAYIAEPDQSAVRDALAEAVATGARRMLCFRVLDRSGTAHWFEDRGNVQRDAAGAVMGISGVLRDITLGKEAAQRLEDERRRLFAVLNMLPGYVTLTTADHQIRFASHGFAELFSAPKGRPCYGVRYGLPGPCEDCPHRRVLATMRSEEWEETLPSGRSFHVWAYPFTDIDGTPVVLQLGIDVTERRELEGLLTEASEKERRRIGRDLHDALGQTLAGLGYLVQGLATQWSDRLGDEHATVDAIVKAVNDAVKQVRALARGLDPVGLDDQGLHDALEGLVHNVHDWFGLDCRLEWRCDWQVRPAVATHLYHIAQEALNNVARHAQADSATVSLQQVDDHLVLTISDDGKGVGGDAGRPAGMGMRVMRHRAAAIGGKLVLSHGPHRGTVVACKVPKARVLAGQGE